jgi:hypothetical protein
MMGQVRAISPINRQKSKPIQYMDVKYISECVDIERRYVRLLIQEQRRERRNEGVNVVSFKNYLAIKRAFYRYAHVTRLYHCMRRQYLMELAKKY